jgi:hypothetical protein
MIGKFSQRFINMGRHRMPTISKQARGAFNDPDGNRGKIGYSQEGT